jgi:hypothetical protein
MLKLNGPSVSFSRFRFLLRYATPPPSNALVKRVMNPSLPVMSRFMILTRSAAQVLSTMGRVRFALCRRPLHARPAALRQTFRSIG